MKKLVEILFLLAIFETTVILTYLSVQRPAVQSSDVWEFVKFFLAIVAFFSAMHQFKAGQDWKMAEFVASQWERFTSDWRVQNAFRMIDWNRRRLYFPEVGGQAGKWIMVDDQMLETALMPVRKEPFKAHEIAIRDCFDTFFDGLQRFGSYVGTELIETKYVESQLLYWMVRLCTTRGEKKKRTIWRYAQNYGYYEGIKDLAEKLLENEHKKQNNEEQEKARVPSVDWLKLDNVSPNSDKEILCLEEAQEKLLISRKKAE